MALARWVVTTDVTLPAGTFTGDALAGGAAGTGYPANYGTGSYAQGAGKYGSAGPYTFKKGTVIFADSGGTGGAGALYTAIGAGNLRAYVQGQDDVGHAGLSN